MNRPGTDTAFTGNIPQFYETYLVPLIFAPYAEDMATRAAGRQPSRVLEIAAGTGAVSRCLAARLAADASLIATDLNQAMLDHAAVVGTARPIEWRQADAMALPFPDKTFDLVVCQFGAMFFPNRAQAYAEARRVLRPGGAFIFNVWDRIEDNEFADTVTRTLHGAFADNPPRFLARLPHGYHDTTLVTQDLALAGFTTQPRVDTLAKRSRALSAGLVAMAYCQGTPLRNEVEQRDASRLQEVTDLARAALAQQFGHGPIDGKIQAHVITIER